MLRAHVRNARAITGICIVTTALLAVSPATPAVNVEFFPVADSYTSELHEDDPHGDLPYLRADNDPKRTMYLKFDVSGITAQSSAALNLWIEKKTRTGLQVRGVSNDWDESTLVPEVAPTPGPIVDD